MKASCLLVSAVLLPLSTVVFAQTEAQSSFQKLKALAGTWEGVITTTPPEPTVNGKTAQAWLRVTSMGNALMHEVKIAGRPDDPITMIYVDGDRLLMTHYCDAGNRPRFVGKIMPDAKTIAFDFLDLTGSNEHGHMRDVSFTVVSPEHHVEEWTFMAEGKGSIRAHYDLQRKK
jgi:hypothetical protein